jgi:hypothetical protein
MNIEKVKNELQDIISGKSSYSYDATIQTITNFFRTSQKTSALVKGKHQNKAEETKRLIIFARENELFYDHIEKDKYVSEGAESKVFWNVLNE